jgi:hypothetical protein
MAIPRGKQSRGESSVVSLDVSKEAAEHRQGDTLGATTLGATALGAGALSASPLYGVAMLKIAMELKKADARPVDELIHGVLSRMRLDEGEFRRFLEANGGLLRAIAQKRYA